MHKLDGTVELDVLPTTDGSGGVRLVIWWGEHPTFEALTRLEALERGKAMWQAAEAAQKKGADDVLVRVVGVKFTIPISLAKTYSSEILQLAVYGVPYLDRRDVFVETRARRRSVS